MSVVVSYPDGYCGIQYEIHLKTAPWFRHGFPQKECFYRSIVGREMPTKEMDESLSASLLSKPYFSIRPPLRLEEGKREDLWICSLAHSFSFIFPLLLPFVQESITITNTVFSEV